MIKKSFLKLFTKINFRNQYKVNTLPRKNIRTDYRRLNMKNVLIYYIYYELILNITKTLNIIIKY